MKPRTSLIVPSYHIREDFENNEFNGLGKCVSVANPDLDELKQDYGLTTCFVFCVLAIEMLKDFFFKSHLGGQIFTPPYLRLTSSDLA